MFVENKMLMTENFKILYNLKVLRCFLNYIPTLALTLVTHPKPFSHISLLLPRYFSPTAIVFSLPFIISLSFISFPRSASSLAFTIHFRHHHRSHLSLVLAGLLFFSAVQSSLFGFSFSLLAGSPLSGELSFSSGGWVGFGFHTQPIALGKDSHLISCSLLLGNLSNFRVGF